MGANEESKLVDEAINDAVDNVIRHAAMCIEFVRGIHTVSDLRRRVKELTHSNSIALMNAMDHVGHGCGLERHVVASHTMNLKLLYFPLATNPATGESFTVFRERVIRCIEAERVKFIAAMRESTMRDKVTEFVESLRGLETTMAMGELDHGATKH